MNSIRPLITITILVVVGAYLYVKINEGPARPVLSGADTWPNETPDGVPPLAATNPLTGDNSSQAPQWPGAVAAAPAPPPLASAAADSNALAPPTAAAASTIVAASPENLPAVPAIPELPELPAPTEAAAATTPSMPLPATTLPTNIPTPRAPDELPSDNNAAASEPTPRQTLSLQTEPPPASAAQAAQSPAGVDRYALNVGALNGGAANPPAVEETSVPVEPTFAASWPEVQTALDRGELARAHQLLSQWYGDPSLTPVEAEKVETLLGQLAGTVVYSTEHQLEPAYVVKPGDTLETIAKQYEVPWQLLAKINGIPAADQVRPGQELKMVRGPFTAVVDLGRSQLTLMLDGRYAGKFPVTVPSAAAVSEGQWLVDQKLVVPSASVAQSAYAPAPAAVVRAIMLRGEAAAGQAASASTLTMIASGGVVVNSLAGTPAIIRVSPQDAEELSDILSVGSRVVIRR